MKAYLEEKGKHVKTFHCHLEFLPYINGLPLRLKENLLKLTEQFGVEYMGLDYIFASLFFEDRYFKSKERFTERIHSLGLTLTDFEELRGIVRSFIDSCFLKLSPYLKDKGLSVSVAPITS